MDKNILEVLSQEQVDELEHRGYRIVPKKPHKGVLISMAIRENHGILMVNSGLPWSQTKTPEYLDGTLRSMSQLYEEAIGEGFVHSGNADQYVEEFENVKEKLKNI